MSRFGYHTANVLSIAAGVVVGLAVFTFVTSGFNFVPKIDGRLFPVVRFGKVTDVFRQAHDAEWTTGRACFTLHMTKLSAAIPEPYHFAVSTLYSPDIKVAVYLTSGSSNARARKQNYEAHAVGQEWPRRYCFELPGTIGDADDMTVTGTAYHQRVLPLVGTNPLWNTETATPTFTIPAVAHDGQDR